MSRIPLIQPAEATGELKSTFEAVRSRFGAVPNGVKALGVSPGTLRGYLDFAGALGGGSLSRPERERIAVLTAQQNECGYCLSAHTLGGKAAGLSDDELVASRQGRAADPRAAAVLAFAAAVLEHRGDVPEVVAEISLNTFTNYANRLVRPEHDFPQVPLALDREAS
jgi:AhpD family alkylhydroperoxidase